MYFTLNALFKTLVSLLVVVDTVHAQRRGGKGGGGADLTKLRNIQNQNVPNNNADFQSITQRLAKTGQDASIKMVEMMVQPSSQRGDSTFLQARVAMPANPTGNEGLNVLLHGDGGNVFFKMPNAVTQQTNLIGVSLLAPNQPMKWGGENRNGMQRPDGPQHAQLVADFIQQTLPQMGVKFDPNQVFFTGVSGGSLTLTSAVMPLFGDKFNAGMLILCGGLPPQANLVPQGLQASKIPQRVHFQTTTNELAQLKQSIPAAIQNFASVAGSSAKFTADGSPNGGHCAFDGKDFFSGVQLMVDNFANIMLKNQGVPGVTAGSNLQPITTSTNPFQ